MIGNLLGGVLYKVYGAIRMFEVTALIGFVSAILYFVAIKILHRYQLYKNEEGNCIYNI